MYCTYVSRSEVAEGKYGSNIKRFLKKIEFCIVAQGLVESPTAEFPGISGDIVVDCVFIKSGKY